MINHSDVAGRVARKLQGVAFIKFKEEYVCVKPEENHDEFNVFLLETGLCVGEIGTHDDGSDWIVCTMWCDPPSSARLRLRRVDLIAKENYI